MSKLIYKRWQILLTLLSLFILASSFYFQQIKGLEPCPLCLMQRFCVILLFLICFLGVYAIRPKRQRILACLQILFALGGLFFAGRQLWLQSLPPSQTPACLPGLDVLIHYFPWRDVMRALLWGAGDCAEISWRWLGLSMPAWAALYFLFMLLAAIVTLRALHRYS